MSTLFGYAVLRPFETLVNRVLQQDSRALGRLRRIGNGRVLAVHCTAPLEMEVFLRTDEDSLSLLSACAEEPDCRISAPAHALAALLLAEDSHTRLRQADITVSGDSMFAAQLQALLRELEIDWEDHLAPLTGHVTSHQSAEMLRGAQQWSRQTREQIRETLREYLQEEAQLLPDREEAAAFADRVDDLRLRIDRLAARLDHLQQNSDPSP